MNHALILGVNRYPGLRSFGAHRIATVLREQAWDVEVIDYAYFWSLAELKQVIDSRITSSTKFVAFSIFFNAWHANLDALVDYIRSTYRIPVVLGGNSVLATKTKADIDYWVDGYGEVAMLELAASICGTTSTRLRFEVSYLPRRVIRALHAYPAYPMSSYAKRFESRDFLQSYEWITVELSRGCKFQCKFCSYPILGVREDNSVSAAAFAAELQDNYEQWGITNYYVADETFNDREEKLRKMADVSEQQSFRPFFSGFLRADLLAAQPQQLEHLARMNFGGQYYGVETFTQAAARTVGKGMNPDRIKQTLVTAREYFRSKQQRYRGTISIIVGLPGETEASMLDTFDWLNQHWQQESINVWYLDLVDAHSINQYDYTNISEFSRNMAQYGISAMPSSAGELSADVPEYYFNFLDTAAYQERFLWQHATMNIFQAKALSDFFNTQCKPNFTVSNWMLHEQGIRQAAESVFASAEPAPHEEMATHEQHMLHVTQYKEKKLNWRC